MFKESKKQYFAPYNLWEDYKAGMYNTYNIIDKDIKIQNAIKLLSNKQEFFQVSMEMVSKWEVSAKVNLTNLNQNRKAWIGAASCMYKYNVPEILTRIAWNSLDKEEQDRANESAQDVIQIYINRLNYHNNVQTLF
jgi:hypothetical protein